MDGVNAMETGERRLGPATCRIRQCTALPERMRERSREVTALLVKPEDRRKGYGTSLMHKVCREADAAGIVLVVWPMAFARRESDMDDEQLSRWYEFNFGFIVIQYKPELLMARLPDGTPRLLKLNPVAEAIQRSKQAT